MRSALWLPLFLVFALALPVSLRAAPALERAAGATLALYTADGRERFLGSAVLWEDGAVAITNAHVVAGEDAVLIVARDGRRLRARVIARDAGRDLALVQVGGALGPGLSAGATPGTGTEIYAIGAPMGEQPAVTRGIVSGPPRQVAPDVPLRLIPHDAAIRPGSSGGPLVDAAGRLIGITARTDEGAPGSGLAYAIAASDLARLVPALLAGTLQPVPRIGLDLRPVDSRIAAALGIGRGGALVDFVRSGGAADRAGLLPGDVLVEAGGVPVSEPGDLAFAIEAALPDGTLPLVILRGGERHELSLPLTAPARVLAPAAALSLPTVPDSYTLAALGVTVAATGAVTKVMPTSPAHAAGLAPGDTILAVNGRPAGDLSELVIEGPVVLLVRRPTGRTEHLVVDPWDPRPRLRPAGDANVLDPAVTVF